MNTLTPPAIEHPAPDAPKRNGEHKGPGGNGVHHHRAPRAAPPEQETLRRVAWEIGEKKPAEAYVPPDNHAGLALVSPGHGYAHWRIRPEWIDQVARSKGGAWHNCRLILRLYDVSYIIFTGLNANHIQDVALPGICGHLFFNVPRLGTWQLAEVGFLLKNGEFIPAARSQTVQFSSDHVSPRGDHAALLVNGRGRVEEVGNLWEQERILQERRKPRLKSSLTIAAFAFASRPTGHEGALATFVSELAAGQAAQGHKVHVFVPATDRLREDREVQGVHYHPLDVRPDGNPIELAVNFAHAAEKRLEGLPAFDLFHLHEWMTGLSPWIGSLPTILSLSSIEATRRNGAPPTPLSEDIQQYERDMAHMADCLLTPPWLRDRVIAELGLDDAHVHAFPMEARMADEWEAPLDFGKVKMEVGVGPLDRMMLFVGPLEHGAGVDILVEALPTLLNRAGNLRLVLVGEGPMWGHLHHRAGQLGVSHAVRILGHVEGPLVTRLMRAAEALVLPSRHRVCFDDAVVDLARKAGRPVVTTHGGPAHLVRHEETGILTYDNPGSMVWAVDRILGDAGHAERMGQNGRRGGSGTVSWNEVARRYLDLCAASFQELIEPRD